MDRGGAETLIMNIYRNIDRSRVQFDFLLSSPVRTAYEDEIESLGGKIYHIPHFLGWNRLSYDKTLRAFLIAHPEHMILHDHLMDSAAETFRVAKKLGRVTIAHSHTVQNGHSIEEGIRFLFRRKLYKVADYRLACSKDAGRWLYRNKKDFTIVNNGIDTEKYSFSEEARSRKRKELGIDPETYLIGNVGRLVKDKNQERIIDIFAVFHKSCRNSKLIIAGDGPMEENIRDRIRHYNLEEDALLIGPRDDLGELYSALDLFLLPSLTEGLGIVLVEAQASGLECVFSSNIPEEVDLIPGLLSRVSLEAPDEEWAGRMEECRTKGTENRYGKNLSVKAAGYDIKETSKQMERLYLSIGK